MKTTLESIEYTELMIGAATIDIKEYCGAHYWTVTLTNIQCKKSNIPISALLARGKCKLFRHAERSALRFIENSLSVNFKVRYD
jgi:hypothetical protein